MKKFPSILFVFSLLFMLTACSSSADPSQESSGQTTSPSSQQDSVSVSNAVLESESTESEQSANNTLIVYFSRWGNTEYPSDVDAITSASIVVDNNSRYGTTEYVANMIAENVGGDLHRIETVTPYTADFDELRDVNHDEMSRNYLPELKESNLDISAYDTVFIGYPVWATDVPQAVLSFLKEYDLSGKTVIPFCTHDGYGAGNSYQTIAEASHAAVLLEGIAIEANVYIPLDNARYTMYTLRNLAGWIDAMPREKMDIVQWNNLEWDIGEFYQDGPLTPLPFYVDTLRRIYQRIRLFFPNAEIIYATGTKVIDEKSPVDPNFERHNSVIEIYNQAAAELMAELNVRVNDLYKISEAFNEEYYSDWVHPNYLGSRLLAEQVVRFLKL